MDRRAVQVFRNGNTHERYVKHNHPKYAGELGQTTWIDDIRCDRVDLDTPTQGIAGDGAAKFIAPIAALMQVATKRSVQIGVRYL